MTMSNWTNFQSFGSEVFEVETRLHPATLLSLVKSF